METTKRTTSLATDGLRGERGQLVAEVGIAERTAADAGLLELVAGSMESGLILDATDDEMRMLRRESAEGVDSLGDGVTGLNDLLHERKVFTDEDVQVRTLVKHARPPLGKKTASECP